MSPATSKFPSSQNIDGVTFANGGVSASGLITATSSATVASYRSEQRGRLDHQRHHKHLGPWKTMRSPSPPQERKEFCRGHRPRRYQHHQPHNRARSERRCSATNLRVPGTLSGAKRRSPDDPLVRFTQIQASALGKAPCFQCPACIRCCRLRQSSAALKLELASRVAH